MEIPLPQVEGSSENFETIIDLQLNEIQFLKKGYGILAQPFENLLQKIVSELILFDFVPYWIPEIGVKFGVPRLPALFFNLYRAAAMAFIGPPEELKTGDRRPSPEHFTMPLDWIVFLVLLQPNQITQQGCGLALISLMHQVCPVANIW